MNRPTDDLLGAWALDALDPDERAALDVLLADDPILRAEADSLRHVVALLGESDANTPPASLRSVVLATATTSADRRPPVAPSSPIDVYRNGVAALSGLLDRLTPSDWTRPALPYEWTVHGLVAHLLVVDRYMAELFGVGEPSDHRAPEHHLRMDDDVVAREVAGAPHTTLERWRAVTSATIGGAPGLDPDAPVTFHVWPFTVGSLLTARGFELWTHADDIRRAIGLPLAAPVAADLAAMSRLSVEALPLTAHLVTDAVPSTRVRVVLTGDGGATYDLVLGGASSDAGGDARGDAAGTRGDREGADARTLTLVADVVDYCRIASRRADADTVGLTVEGDAALATLLLRAAAVVAI